MMDYDYDPEVEWVEKHGDYYPTEKEWEEHCLNHKPLRQ